MNTLKELKNICNNTKKLVLSFPDFKQVYLFGSTLYTTNNHDIDILIIYMKYSNSLKNALQSFSKQLTEITGKMIDITALSIEEEKEVAFLKKIEPHYLRIK